MHQNKGPIHHSFPAPQEQKLSQFISTRLCQETKNRGAHQDAAIITDERLQNISEQSVSLNKINYGGQCLRGYMLKPHCLVTTRSGGSNSKLYYFQGSAELRVPLNWTKDKNKDTKTHCRWDRSVGRRHPNDKPPECCAIYSYSRARVSKGVLHPKWLSKINKWMPLFPEHIYDSAASFLTLSNVSSHWVALVLARVTEGDLLCVGSIHTHSQCSTGVTSALYCIPRIPRIARQTNKPM